MRIWAALAVLFGLFHMTKPKPVTRRKTKAKSHRQFYRNGFMGEELDALDLMSETFEMHEDVGKRVRSRKR